MKKLRMYVPGLLSLCLLFPLLLHKLTQWGVFQKDYILEVAWYSPTAVTSIFPPPRDYTVINLTGDAPDDHIKIQYAKIIVNEMVTQFDTTRGVRVHFADSSKYHSFIEVLAFCNQQDVLGYAPYENDLWIFNLFESEEQRKHMPIWSCLPLTLPDVDYTIQQELWPLIFLFILLSGLSLRQTLLRSVRYAKDKISNL
jgi:hypothetical protein